MRKKRKEKERKKKQRRKRRQSGGSKTEEQGKESAHALARVRNETPQGHDVEDAAEEKERKGGRVGGGTRL